MSRTKSVGRGPHTKGNELIARFMFPEYRTRMGLSYYMIEEFDIPQEATEEWLFHKSWDWLMPVIEKIGKIDVEYEPLSNVSLYSPIEDVYKAVVEFIKSLKTKNHD